MNAPYVPNPNRFTTRLNRDAQQINRKADFSEQLAFIRSVAFTNQDAETKELKLSIGTRTKDDVFTVMAQYLKHDGYHNIRLMFPGVVAEQALRDKLKKGDAIRFTGLVPLNQPSNLKYCVVSMYKKITHEAAQTAQAHGEYELPVQEENK